MGTRVITNGHQAVFYRSCTGEVFGRVMQVPNSVKAFEADQSREYAYAFEDWLSRPAAEYTPRDLERLFENFEAFARGLHQCQRCTELVAADFILCRDCVDSAAEADEDPREFSADLEGYSYER